MSDNAVWVRAHELAPNDSSSNARSVNLERLQSAADYAFNNARQVARVPAGVFYCDPGLYVDPPGNLRNDPQNPTNFAFSMHLRGVGGLGNHNNHGTILRFVDNMQPAVILGTGQGVRASDFAIVGPWGASSRAALPEGGIGLALAGGNGGLSRALVENVHVANFREGYTTGYNRDTLCDSVTFQKCSATGCHDGLHVKGTQNWIVNLFACDFGGCKRPVYSPVGKPVNIFGGNFSTPDALHKAFAISNVSGLTAFNDSIPGSGFLNWSFTATITSPDQPMADGAYDAFAIKTTGYGVVPLQMVDYNSGTGVITLKFYPGWLESRFRNNVNAASDIDIQSEVQSASTLYACELITTFSGFAINATGIHIENPNALTALLLQDGGFAGDRVSRIDRAIMQYTYTHGDKAAGSEDAKALFYCQQAFPFIKQASAAEYRAVVSDTQFPSLPDGVIIETRGRHNRMQVRNSNMLRPNITIPFQCNLNGETGEHISMGRGIGEWDASPFIPTAATGNNDHDYYGAATSKLGRVPFRGFAPAAMPRLRKGTLDAIAAGPGTLGTYPALHGEAVYLIVDETVGASGPLMARSAHQLWSYGQDLSINWSIKGGLNGTCGVLTLSDVSLMFAGLKLILNDGTGDDRFVVTGVFPTLGYVTVLHLDNVGRFNIPTTTYTGSVVKQEPYAITTIG